METQAQESQDDEKEKKKKLLMNHTILSWGILHGMPSLSLPKLIITHSILRIINVFVNHSNL